MFRGRLIRQGALCLAGVLLAGSFSIPTFAANDNSHIIRANGGYDPASYPAKTLDASFTQESIVLDGVLEDAYHNASSSKIQNVKPVDSYVYPEGGETSGELYALWDGPNLYLGIEVTDASVVKESEYKSKGAVGDNPAIPSKKVLTGYMEWFGYPFPQYSNIPDMDSVEIGIDLFHDQTVYETDTKGIVTVDAAGNFYYFRNSNIPSLGCPLADPQHPEYRDLIKGYAVSDRLDEDGNVIGYTVEIAFHIEETAMTNGTEIGVDIKINDASEVLDHYETVEVPNPDYIPSVSENDPVSGNDPTDPVSDNDPANPAGTTSDNDPVNPAGTTSDNDPVGSSDPDSGDPSDNGSNNQADPDANNGANNQADPDADNGSNGQTDPGADNGSNNQADPDADNGSNGQADPDADNGSNNQADPDANNGSNSQTDPDADNGSNSQTDPDAGNSSGDQPMAGNDTLSEVSGDDPDQEDVINTTDPTISVEQPVYVVKHLSSIFWSHDQDSVYTSFDHEHANSIDWGSVTLRNWNGEAFAYSNWLLQKTMNYLNSASFQKGVYTADSQAALEIAMNNAQVYLSSTSQIPSATKAATDQLLTAVKNLRWADTRYPDPADLPVQTTLPNPYQFFQSSRMVKTAADWKDRRAQILDLAQFYEYGYKPSYDTVEVIDVSPFKKGETDPSSMWGGKYSCDGSRITLKVTANERSTYLSFSLYSTSQEAKEAAGHGSKKAPVVLSFDGDIAAYRNAGISVIGLPSVCSDTRSNDYAWNHRNGSFYDLYPYSRNGEAALKEVSNEMASAWGASVVIDALEQMAEDKNDVVADLAVDQLAVTGFSINGKYAFVSAVFDDRIDVCIPGAAGATGPSPWRYVYTGQEYDWSGTIYASTDPSVSNAQYAWGTELMANSIRHNRVRETELFRHFLTPGHMYAYEDNAYGFGTRLPYDQNDLIATLAPRAIIIENTVNDYNDGCTADALGAEIAKSVYRNLGYDADELVNFNYRTPKGGDPHGNDDQQRGRSADYLNHYFFGTALKEENATCLKTDPFGLAISNGQTQSPFDLYWGGYNTITGGKNGASGTDGWYFYKLSTPAAPVAPTTSPSSSGTSSGSGSTSVTTPATDSTLTRTDDASVAGVSKEKETVTADATASKPSKGKKSSKPAVTQVPATTEDPVASDTEDSSVKDTAKTESASSKTDADPATPADTKTASASDASASTVIEEEATATAAEPANPVSPVVVLILAAAILAVAGGCFIYYKKKTIVS